MRVDIAIPAYNEEACITQAVLGTLRVFENEASYQVRVIVADNASNDDTAQLAQQAGADVLFVPERGKGAAVRSAAQTSTADVFAFLDADLSVHPSELPRFIRMIEEGGADIVIGSRLKIGAHVHRAFLRTLSSQIFNAIRASVLGISVQDTQCPLKVMNKKGLNTLVATTESGWFLDIDFLARAERAGLIVVEVPISWEEFRVPGRKSKIHLIRDGLESLRALGRVRRTIKGSTP